MAERDWDRERDWERGRRHRDEGRYGGYYSSERERDYPRRGDERGFLERLREELRSWFGEDEPERGRARDDREREAGRWGGGPDVDPAWARQWGYLEGRGQRGAERGSARGGGYGGGYGARPGYRSGAEYGHDSPMGGWDWSGQQRWERQSSPGQSSGYGEAWRGGGDDTESERYGAGAREGARRGSFAGRGPRGYQRSDERIREDICERMCDCAELDPTMIEILVVSGEVTLQGNVNDRYDKRLAEDLTQDVSGVREVNNQLRVGRGSGQERQEGQQRQEGQEQPTQQNRPGDPPRYRAA